MGLTALTVIDAYFAIDQATAVFAKESGKDRASDIPSWAKGKRPLPGESAQEFADRLLSEKYGAGNYNKGPGSEFSKVKKWGDRGCR